MAGKKRNLLNPVRVPKDVYSGLTELRKAPEFHRIIFEEDNVQLWLADNGHQAASDWVRAHGDDYFSGIFGGFKPIE